MKPNRLNVRQHLLDSGLTFVLLPYEEQIVFLKHLDLYYRTLETRELLRKPRETKHDKGLW